MGGKRNPDEIITAHQVESDIVRLSDAMDEVTSDLKEHFLDAARKLHAYKVAKLKGERAYKIAHAEAILDARQQAGSGPQGKTTVDEREAMASKATQQAYADSLVEDLWMDWLIADAYVETDREVLRTMRTQIDGLRTIAASIRAQT